MPKILIAAGFKKVETDGNWCEIDKLNGKQLKDGEKLIIQFADGTEETHSITVLEDSRQVSDMGNPWTIPISRAFIKIKYHGTEKPIRIVGLKARRV